MGDCLERTPFTSLVALLILTPALGVWAYTLFIGLPFIIQGIGQDLLNFDIRWLGPLRVGIIVTAIVIFSIGLLFTVFGILATGATRKAVYSHEACVLGGRITAGLFIVTCFLMVLLLIGLTMLHMFPTIGSLMGHGFCRQNRLYTEHSKPDCFRFQLWNYGFTYNVTNMQVETERIVAVEIIDKFRLDALCQASARASSFMYVATACSFMATAAFMLYLCALVTNYTRIQLTREVAEYRDAFEQQEYQEMNSLGSRKIYYG